MNNFYKAEDYYMGTVITQKVYGQNTNLIIELTKTEIKKIENKMSFFKPDSEVSIINKNAGIIPTHTSKDTLEVIKEGKSHSLFCDGYFDMTCGPIIKLWGVFTENERIPNEDEIKEALPLVGSENIIINEENSTVLLRKRGQSIDLGAIAKGYTADKIIEIYKENNIQSAFINLGGNVSVLGNKPDGSKWNIGIQDPYSPRGQCIGVLSVSDKAVVTSGDYVRYFEKENKKYHHIIDPRTGHPSQSNLISATIICDKSTDADALSTAVFIMGLEKGFELINKIQGVYGIFITNENKVHISDQLKGSFHPTCMDKFEYYYNENFT